jgi:sulfonate transport system substrate-binding protein
VLSHGGAFRDDLGVLYVRDETLKDPGKAAALREYVKLWGRAHAWRQSHREEWAELYYVRNQGLSPDDARHIVESAGDIVVPRDWSEARRLQQGSIDLLAAEAGRKAFDAATIFDPRFETIGADAFEAALSAAPASSAP